ncbi:hypothetical protein [Roseivirga pacifica]|uniref:hypothetical protein n=1 Tax=Roseivirga pacifica TaxID=1267423 RepID=UPI003BAFD56D
MKLKREIGKIKNGHGKINVLNIVKEHFNTIKHATSGKTSRSDRWVFYYTPILISILPVLMDIRLQKDTINLLITVQSIFIGLLLNLLVLLYALIQRKPEKPERKQLLREVFHNISFSILLAIVSILGLLFSLFKAPLIFWKAFDLDLFIDFLNYILLTEFVIILLMILKRINVLLTKEFK